MRPLRIVYLALLACVATPAFAGKSAFEKSLMKLSPEERAHQACVAKGLDTIRKDKRLPGVDRIVPDTFKRANFEGSIVSAKGGAVRARQHWYAISYDCTVSDDQLKGVAFTYKIGDEIPAEEWEDKGLWR